LVDKLFKALKLFLIFIITSSLIVWLSNNSGKVEIISKNYLIQTNIFGLSLVIFLLFFLIFSAQIIFRFFKNIPKEFKFKRRGKHLMLANESLDNIAEAILLGDSDVLEKNSRKLKKYLNNDFFSSFMLFNSSLINSNYVESERYLKILESIPRAEYISKRAKVIFLFKNNKVLDAKNLLLDLCKEYPRDIWFHDKLSRIYALEKNWKEAHGLISRLQPVPSEKKKYFANLKILSGEPPTEAFRLSEDSIEVVKETLKYYINKKELKKAIDVIKKTWMKLLCIEIIEIFMSYKVQNEKEILQRYKLIYKNLKKNINEKSNETKIALAYASFKASIWGESQNFLDQIDKNEWDERVVDLYKKISEKTKKAILPFAKVDLIDKPVWKCNSCEFQSSKWELICINCSSLNTVVWTKSKSDISKERDFFREFLQNSLGHLPKMKREN
tara:strand:+ start:111 stop:1439 length:1329 start_codon:yes stop_codon:yes gene_type:complete